MKILHLSDLHLGKRLGEISLLEDQKYMLRQLLEIAGGVQAVIIAGDIYDKPVPPAEAVELFDMFLTELSAMGKSVFVISGNHDSAGRISFASGLLGRSGVYISPVYSGQISPITLQDEYGEVDFYLLAFIKPVHVRRAFEGSEPASFNDALKLAVERINADYTRRCVIVAHQFITGAGMSGSEEINVGGLDNVDISVFSRFDYAALGHIHRAQNVGTNGRYCGTMLKYSLSEAEDEKTATIVTLGKKGDVSIEEILLKPLRNLRRIQGRFSDIISSPPVSPQDYIHIVLTDGSDVPEAMSRLRKLYPNIVHLEYAGIYQAKLDLLESGALDDFDELQLFSDFYAMQNGSQMSRRQYDYALQLFAGLGMEEDQ